MIVQAFLKLLHFAKIFESVGIVVRMAFGIIIEIIPFFVLMSISILFFTLGFQVLHVKFTADEY